MYFLIFSILSSVIVANLLKHFSKLNGISNLQMFLGNYLIASLLGFVFTIGKNFNLYINDIILSMLSGLFFLLGFILYLNNISKNGLSISVSTFRISLIIPIVGSIILFKEYLSFLNYFGILLILFSFILFGTQRNKYDLKLIIFLFFVAGTGDFFPKLFKQYGHQNPDSIFLFMNFISAFVFNLIYVLIKKEIFLYKSLLLGIILGIPNFFMTLFLMKAFNTVPATLAYPLLSSSIVILTMATDYILWKKRFTSKEYFIFAMIITGIILSVIKF